MNWKKIGKSLLYPHAIVMIILIPVSALLLILAFTALKENQPFSYVSYVISAYTLFVWCIRIPRLIKRIKALKNENKYVQKWQEDQQLRASVILYSALAWNIAYATLQAYLGILNKSFWFFSISFYYISLAIMRFLLVKHTRRLRLGENIKAELLKYRTCGIILLIMNLFLSLMIFFMVYWNRHFVYDEITAIAVAAYTFTTFTVSIVMMVRDRKINSPVLSAIRIISLCSGCVSMLILESAMLNTFGGDEIQDQQLMLGITGGVIALFVLAMAIYMIVSSTKKLNKNE
ncbi:MAG: hypothetical protein IJA82_06495 [Clostridia bacterium]|nr:hypothetical protein [Clostridia bacterium]